MTGEGIFYSAQDAFAYRGGAITQWTDVSNKSAYEAVANALAALGSTSLPDACSAIAPTLAAAIPGGLSGAWSSLVGLERAGVMLVVMDYRGDA